MPNQFDQPTPLDPLTIGELISLADAAEKSGFSTTYLREIAQRGRLKAKKITGNWVTTLAAIEEYKSSRKYIAKEE